MEARDGGPLVTLHRSQCYGSCPEYFGAVDVQGAITFDGRLHRYISDNLGGRCRVPHLISWAARVDEALGTAEWVKCDGKCEKDPPAVPSSSATA